MSKLNELIDNDKIQIGEPIWIEMPDGSRRQAVAQWSSGQITVGDGFFTGLRAGQIGGPGTRIFTVLEHQMLTILHELGHATGASAAKHYTDGKLDFAKSIAFDREIAAKCF